MTIRCIRLPMVRAVPPEAIERLQRKFTAAKSVADRARFWAAVQRSKQPV